MGDLILRGQTLSQTSPGYVPLRAADDGSLVHMERYTELAARGFVFTAQRVAITIPVIASGLVSVFGLYNPPSSGKMLELMDIELQNVLAATVVDGYGIYYSNGTNASSATFTTQLQSAIENARIGEGQQTVTRFYSAVTHVGTPVLADLVGGNGAVTTTDQGIAVRDLRGRVMVPPGTLISIAGTTAASTGSGMAALLRWAETPYKPY